MKAIFILIALFIASLVIIEFWGIGTLITVVIILIFLFILLISKGGKTKAKQDSDTSGSNNKIDHYSEAFASQNETILKKEPQYRKTNTRGTKPGFKFEDIEGHERLSGDILEQDLSEADPSDYFYDKKVVFTGKLSTYEREELALILKQRGADINTTISKKTDIVIIGDKPGPAKMEQIGRLLAGGSELDIIYESDLEGYIMT